MKISLARSVKGERGSQNFLRKLVNCLQRKHNVKLVDSRDRSDIHLLVISGEHKKRARNVVRIDGVYYDKPRLKNNIKIRKSIATADAVVFQSKWSRDFALGMLKVKPKKYAIIHNGADPEDYNNVPVDKMEFDKLFISCAHWRQNKRAEAIVKAFIMANHSVSMNMGLLMVGDGLKPFVRDPSVKFIGPTPHAKLASYYASADYMIHICHIDSCPNSVVEGLVAGLPVVSNNISGTPELVGKTGVIVDIDKPFNFKPIPTMKLTSSRNVDTKKLARGILEIVDRNWEFKREDLYLSTIAKKYYDFFVKLVS